MIAACTWTDCIHYDPNYFAVGYIIWAAVSVLVILKAFLGKRDV